MTTVNNMFINCEFEGLMDFKCLNCGETVEVPINADKNEEYKCSNCSRTYTPRQALQHFSEKFPDKKDVIPDDNEVFQRRKQRFENDEIDVIKYNRLLTNIYNELELDELVSTCNYQVSGGATIKEGKKIVSLQYGGGKSRISGISSVEEGEEFAEKVAGKLKEGKVVNIEKPSSYNISKTLEHGLTLRPLYQILKDEAADELYEIEYNPETFPGLITYFVHGYEVRVKNEQYQKSNVDNDRINVMAGDKFLFGTKFDVDPSEDKSLRSNYDRKGEDVDVNDFIETEVESADVEQNEDHKIIVNINEEKVTFNMRTEKHKIKITSDLFNFEINRSVVNVLLYNSSNVVINTKDLEKAEQTFSRVESIIKEHSTGVSKVPHDNEQGYITRYVFNDEFGTDHSQLKEEMSNLPMNPEQEDL